MGIKEGSIVVRITDSEGELTKFRVEKVDGGYATMRSLKDYMLATDHIDNLALRYQTDYFDVGDTVRIREDYVNKYNEADGGNDLTVVANSNTSGRTSTTAVANNNGDDFTVLSERLYLVKPAKSFKAGDRVVVDPDLARKYDNDSIFHHVSNVGVLVMTEDSGSRAVQTTSHVEYEKDGFTNNIPTRWLKLYEEPAKRVVGEPIRPNDVVVGDTLRATYSHMGMSVTSEGAVSHIEKMSDGTQVLYVDGGARFPLPGLGTTYILVEEAPEPVDENLQRLLDAEIGDIAHGTYAHEYWKKVGDDEWMLLELDAGLIRTTDHVFGSFYKLKYGTLVFYRKVEDAD